jgi:hypothetical protein
MNNMTIFISDDGEWWKFYRRDKSLNYSSLIDNLGLDKSCMKKIKLKLRKGSGSDTRYEHLRFKYKKGWYQIVNSGEEEYELC